MTNFSHILIMRKITKLSTVLSSFKLIELDVYLLKYHYNPAFRWTLRPCIDVCPCCKRNVGEEQEEVLGGRVELCK